uniref:Uncharacterized protein n=1 Tax=Manihot esculenta TaxID=3983 RepID=A0A2C9W8A5_MANES
MHKLAAWEFICPLRNVVKVVDVCSANAMKFRASIAFHSSHILYKGTFGTQLSS